MPQQETLLAEYLKGAGYATGHYGIPYSNDYPQIPVYDERQW